MKSSTFLFVLFLILSCKENQNNSRGILHADTTFKHDTIYLSQQNGWQKGFGLTHDPEVDSIWFKPANFYINDPKCSGLAIDFYYGFLRPSDNGTTDELLKLATNENSKLRPFYRWCLNKTIQVSDGALAEHIGEPARRYAERFPREFFEYMQEDTSGSRYDNWTAAINYSGYYENENWQKNDEMVSNVIKTMKINYNGCNQNLHFKIEKFAKDCFAVAPE